jgi:anti-sigma B factor antagonist
MNIVKKQDGTTLTIELDGRLDTVTSPQLESELRSSVDGITELIFDLANLAYVSSAGLRVLLAAQKVMNRQGKMIIRNVTPEIMDIFDVTGFVDILNIEN